MSARRDGETSRRSGGPGARRAVARWAYRMFLRERRQQAVIIGVIAVAVAAAVCGVSMMFNLPDSSAASFGTAQQRITYTSDDPANVAARTAAAAAALGTIEVIGHASVPIPGSADVADARYEDPHGAYASSTMRLRRGRYPTSPAEVSVTDGLSKSFGLAVGDHIAISGIDRTVVGIVENPYDLGDEFLLLQPSPDSTYTSVTILAAATDDELSSLGPRGDVETRTSDVSRAVATATLAASTVVFLLVALVACAGFAVVAQRRMRQLGMLAAVGATDRHLRLVLLVHGAIVGVISSITGTVLGLAAWVVVSHHLEVAAGHRIDVANLPWPLLIGALLAGMVVPIAAAWWPSRAMPRMSIVAAISARPPRPRRPRASVLAAVASFAAGVTLTALSKQTNAPMLIAGMVTIVVGILLACPAAIRAMARAARRAPVSTRVALRDLGRYQARAGAALAAISLALGIPVAIVLVASAADRTAAESNRDGNLADTQLLITINHTRFPPTAPDLTTAQLDAAQAVIDDLATALGHAELVPLAMAVDPLLPAAGRPLIELAQRIPGNDSELRSADVYVGTPELLQFLGIEPAGLPASAEVVARQGSYVLIRVGGPGRGLDDVVSQTIAPPRYTSLPNAFLTESLMDQDALVPTPIGWILQAPHPLTPAQIEHARQVAVASGFTIEARHGPSSRAALRNIATAAGALFALVIVAMTVGTIRSEAAGELRTLTATGANGAIRRSLTAATAAALAMAGVVLGIVGAYAGLVGAYARHLSRLGDVPFSNLVAALLGVPLLSLGVGWCLGGREPESFARAPAE